MKTTVSVEATAKSGSPKVSLGIRIENKAPGLISSNVDACANKVGVEVVNRFNFYHSTNNSMAGKMTIIRPSEKNSLDSLLVRLTNDISSMNAEYFKQYPEVETKFEVTTDVP